MLLSRFLDVHNFKLFKELDSLPKNEEEIFMYEHVYGKEDVDTSAKNTIERYLQWLKNTPWEIKCNTNYEDLEKNELVWQ